MNFTTINSLLKLRFTLFGLPSCLAAAILPYAIFDELGPPPARVWLYILLAFVCARTAGMAFNELFDREFDADNPRTQHRVLPSGEVRPAQAALLGWSGLLLFLIVCSQINTVVFALSPAAALLIWGYSYTKRFTHLCHFVLGLIQFLAPVMAWAAVTGELGLLPALLGGAIFCTISASDILYAFQDVDFDKKAGLKSIPVALSWKGCLRLSRLLYLGAIVFLGLVGVLGDLNALYYVGVGGAAGILLAAQRKFSYDEPAEFPPGFFTVNAQVAFLTLLAVLGAVIWRGSF